jgi:hypothetical protein
MHGFNQGVQTVLDLIRESRQDIIAIQEHWLTPANMHKLNDTFPGYLCAGTSAMSDAVARGVLHGRPFGGVAILCKKRLLKCTEIIIASERSVIVRIGDILIVNVYCPYVGTTNRQFLYEELLCHISSYCFQNCNFKILICGDHGLYRCDNVFIKSGFSDIFTFYNDISKHKCYIDYFVASTSLVTSNYDILDVKLNLSDHRPVVCKCLCQLKVNNLVTSRPLDISSDTVLQFRWDKANIRDYQYLTGLYLQEIYEYIVNIDINSFSEIDLNYIYDTLINVLASCGNNTIPRVKKNFFKFCWSQELTELKKNSIAAQKAWISAGRPNTGEIFSRYRKCQCEYKSIIRRQQTCEKQIYTNDLHEALLKKQGEEFWKCWKAKFDTSKPVIAQVDGISSPSEVAKHFATHFSKILDGATNIYAEKLWSHYRDIRNQYFGNPHLSEHEFYTELVERVINKMQCGKAAGLDEITAEHLRYCHPLLPVILAKLFNLIVHTGSVPNNFCISYTVPILKGTVNVNSKSISANDFRGISISPIISKVFEHCILDRYSTYFTSSDNQFGFKRGSGCNKAILTLKTVVNHYISCNSTENICAIEISKASDRMNNEGLFCKLMDQGVPLSLLAVLEYWFLNGSTCVRWINFFSEFFCVKCGVRQGGVLSPFLFAIYMDSVIDAVKKANSGCKINFVIFFSACIC